MSPGDNFNAGFEQQQPMLFRTKCLCSRIQFQNGDLGEEELKSLNEPFFHL